MQEFRKFQRKAEALLALICAHGQGEVGVAGINWATRTLQGLGAKPTIDVVIDFAAGADLASDEENYLLNKGGAFGGIYSSQLREMGLRGMTNASFDDFGPPRFAGTLYHVVKTSMPGAFHPKITLLVGEKKGRLLVGSANLTALGLGGNRELVADISFTDELPELVSLFGQALSKPFLPLNNAHVVCLMPISQLPNWCGCVFFCKWCLLERCRLKVHRNRIKFCPYLEKMETIGHGFWVVCYSSILVQSMR